MPVLVASTYDIQREVPGGSFHRRAVRDREGSGDVEHP